MRRLFWIAILVVSTSAAAAQAKRLTIDQVRDMAFEKGIVTIEEIELDDDGVWEVEGDDASGKEIEMEVDAASGEILRVERH